MEDHGECMLVLIGATPAVYRLTLISCLEELFARVQVFGTELALAKCCQKEWPSEHMDQAVAEMKRGLN